MALVDGLSVAIMVFLHAVATQAGSHGYWECTATGSSGGLHNIPVKWTCDISDHCCLTGNHDTQSGCCKSFTTEAVYTFRPSYITCAPYARRTYYCPGNRECCVVATSLGKNQTGCCVAHTATDSPSTGSGGFKEQEEATTTTNSSLPVHTLVIIVMAVIFVIVLASGLLGYYLNTARHQRRRGWGSVRRVRLNDAGGAGGGELDDDSAAILAPPTYWDTVDETPPTNSGGPAESRFARASPVPLMVVALTPGEVESPHAHALGPRAPPRLRASGPPQYTAVPQQDEVAVTVSPAVDKDEDEQQGETGSDRTDGSDGNSR